MSGQPEPPRDAGAGGERAASWFRVTATRPVAVLMVFLAVMVFGGFSIRLLPLNLMPDISYPKITVRTEYPGAAPAEVEDNVSRPLEEFLGVVTGLTRIESVSRAGYSDVILEFAWDTDMDEANQDVLEKLDAVEPMLPDDVEQPLILRYDPTLDPVLTLSIEGSGERYAGTAGLQRLRRVADRDVRRLLEPLQGVAAVKVKGGLEEEIHVELDERQLERTGIGIDTVISRLQQENVNLAGGQMRDGKTSYLVRTVNEFATLEDIAAVVVLHRGGRDVRLGDLAKVTSSHRDRDVITRVNGKDAVEVEVYKEADANIVEMAARVRTQLDEKIGPRLEKQYDLQTRIASDRSRFIESSLAEVRDTTVIGGLLAVIVLLAFLRDIRSTIIVAISIPVSVLVTFAPLHLSGVSLNIMSLGGLALGVGMLVDNSIVVLESIHRCREEGDSLIEATIRGVSEVGGAVTASTLTTVAVFLPMVFVEGVAGQMFGDLGIAVVSSLLASLAVALFLIPMLTSRGGLQELRGAEADSSLWRALRWSWRSWSSWHDLRAPFGSRTALLWLPYRIVRFVVHAAFELIGKLLLSLALLVAIVFALVFGGLSWGGRKIFSPVLSGVGWIITRLEHGYPPVIRFCLRQRALVYAVTLASFGFMVWGGNRLDTELIPALHQSEFTIEATLPVGTPLQRTDELLRPVEQRVLQEVPNLGTVTTVIGSERDNMDAGERGEHTARVRVTLEAGGAGETDAKSGQGAAEMEDAAKTVVRGLVTDVPGLTTNITRPVLFSFKTPVEVEVRGHDLADLQVATQRVEERLRELPGLHDVRSSMRPGNPEVHIHYDREALARTGLDLRAVAERIRDEIQGSEATRFSRADRKVPVVVRLEDARDTSLAELRELIVNPGGARPIPLRAVASLEVGRGPNEIRRVSQQRIGLVTADLEGQGLGAAVAEVQAALAELELPEGTSTAITGQSEEWQRSSRSLFLALGLSIFLVYVIMASQFENLIYPLIILISIPLAFVGVVAALLLFDVPVSVIVFLGAILLAGIVVNNAIVLVDYVGQLKQRGHDTATALEMAGKVRLRPILMTTLTTVLGLVPMALGLGDGAEIRAPMAMTVIAGLSASTLLTLLVIPTLYQGVDALLGVRRAISPAMALEQELALVTPDQLAPEDPNEDESDAYGRREDDGLHRSEDHE